MTRGTATTPLPEELPMLATLFNLRVNPKDYDAVELAAVEHHEDGTCDAVAPGAPIRHPGRTAFTVYLHVRPDSARAVHAGGGVEALVDLPDWWTAAEVARTIAQSLRVPMYDHVDKAVRELMPFWCFKVGVERQPLDTLTTPQ